MSSDEISTGEPLSGSARARPARAAAQPPPSPGGSRELFRLTVVAFVPLALVGVLVMLVLLVVLTVAGAALFRSDQEKLVRIGRLELAGELGTVLSDARYLARLQTLQGWLQNAGPADRDRLARELLAFAGERRIYDRIRYVDEAGREVARVNWKQGAATAVPPSALVDSVDAYYLDALRELEAGQVYVSRFELDRRGGAVEEPPKPVIRVGAPVFDETRRRRGTLLLSYLGAPLLDRIKRLAEEDQGQMWLLNRNGYFLVGPSPEDEWTFMFPERAESSMAITYPEAWARMRGGEPQGQFRLDGGLFTYARTRPVDGETALSGMPSGEPRAWWVVSYVPAAVVAAGRNRLILAVAAAYLALAAVLAGVAVLMARQRLRRQHAEARLRASDARFRQLVESAPDSVVLVDAAGRIEVVNAQTERLFGYSRDALVGQAVETLVPERYRSAHADHRAGYLSEPKLRPMGADLELRGRRADGTEFPVEISLSPVDTEEGRLILADIRDVSGRRAQELKIQELNERLTQDNAELAALNEELEAFSYSVSHDLRAPLRAIDGFSKALLEDCAEVLDDEGQAHLDRVRRAAQRMGQLIDDLLKLSRVARVQLEIQEVDVSALAKDVAADLQARQPDRQVEARIEDGLRVRADPRLLRIALENLIGNAWKFTAGRAPGRIELDGIERDGATVLRLRDNGVGFDMRYVDQLFRAFQRLHDARDFPGTGIGLATVQRIVHKHGGRVWAEAQPDQGAAFYFTL
jgi:PAS domain S-box-containing protein